MMEEIGELLSEYESVTLGEDEALSFFGAFANDQESQKSVFNYLRNSEEKSNRDSRIFEMLFYSYRRYPDKSVVMQYIPSLIFFYWGSLECKKWKEAQQKLEILLLTLYNSNLELLSESFRIPSLGQSSIYHDSSRLEVTEVWGKTQEHHRASSPSLSVVPRITAQNRQRILASLYRLFNSRLGDYPKFVLKSFCDVSIALLQKGYPKRPNSSKLPSVSRISVSGQGLLELLYGGYFCSYNELQRLGTQLVECVHFRATLDANPAVLSASLAARSLLLSQGTPPATVTTPTFSQIAKNMITNASFRTKKMGDDIPVVEVNKESHLQQPMPATLEVSNAKNLTSITEENGGPGVVNNVVEEENQSSKSHHSRAELKEKIISKLPLKKKNKSSESNNNSSDGSSRAVLGPIQPSTTITPLTQPITLSTNSNSSSCQDKNKSELQLLKKKQHFSNNGEISVHHEIDSLEQIEELIKKKNLPPETITIHSPESGTTLF